MEQNNDGKSLVDFYDSLGEEAKPPKATPTQIDAAQSAKPKQTKPNDLVSFYDDIDTAAAPAAAEPPKPPAPAMASTWNIVKGAPAAALSIAKDLVTPAPKPQVVNAPPEAAQPLQPSFARPTRDAQNQQTFNKLFEQGQQRQINERATRPTGMSADMLPEGAIEGLQEPISKKIPFIGMSLSELADKMFPEHEAVPQTNDKDLQMALAGEGVSTRTGVYDAVRRSAKMAAGIADWMQSPEGIAVAAAEALSAGSATPVVATLLGTQFATQGGQTAKEGLDDILANGINPENSEKFLQGLAIAEAGFLGPAGVREVSTRAAAATRNAQWLSDANAAMKLAWNEKLQRRQQSSIDKGVDPRTRAARLLQNINPFEQVPEEGLTKAPQQNQAQRRATLEVPETNVEQPLEEKLSEAELEQLTRPDAQVGKRRPSEQSVSASPVNPPIATAATEPNNLVSFYDNVDQQTADNVLDAATKPEGPKALPPAPVEATPVQLPGGGVMRPEANATKAKPASKRGEQTITPTETPGYVAAARDATRTETSKQVDPVEVASTIGRQFPDLDHKVVVKMAHAASEAATKQVNDEFQVAANPDGSIGLANKQPKPDEALSKRVANYYDETKSDPNDPIVEKSYNALNEETHQQFEDLKRQGYKFDFTDNPETYASSSDLAKDVNENKHLTVWTGEPPEHGLMTPEQNAEFRAVHDVYGHGKPQATFGHAGEEKAYESHYEMYSEAARPALATETRGQNSALHFSDKLGNDPAHTYEDSTKVPLKFPEQKAIAMPHELRKTKAEESEGLGLASKAEPAKANADVVPKGWSGVEPSPQPPAFEARITPRGSTIYTSREGLNLLKTVGVNKDSIGVTLPINHIHSALDRLKNNQTKAAIEFRAAVKQIRTEQGRIGAMPIKVVPRPGEVAPREGETSFNAAKETYRHEHNHVQMLSQHGLDIMAMHRALADDVDIRPIAERAYNALAERGYSPEHSPWELTAHLAAGQYRELNLTPNEAVKLMAKVVDNIEGQVGADNALKIFEQSHPRFKEVLDDVRTRTSARTPKQEATGRMGAEPGEVYADQEAGRAERGEQVVPRRGAEDASNIEGGLANRSNRSGQAAKTDITSKELKQVGATDRVIPAAEDFARELERKGVTQNIIAAAERGSVARYWYKNSKKAFDHYFGDDSQLLAKLTAALSTGQDPKQNLIGAVETYRKWADAGRPTDEVRVKKIIDGVSRIGGERYAARYQNALTVLTGAGNIDDVDLSGMKVRSFWRNLAGQYEYATLDRHMATLAGVNQRLIFGRPSGYLGSQAVWKRAAAELGWTTAETQAASWTFVKPFTDMVQNGVLAKEALRNMPEVAKEDLKDFSVLIKGDPDVRQALDEHYKQQGTTLDEFEAQHGQATTQYGRKKETPTEFDKGFAKSADRKIKADQAESRALRAKIKQRKLEEAGQGKLGFANVGDKSDKVNPGDALVKSGGKQLRAAELAGSGFITADGRTIKVGDHAPALEEAGLLAEEGNYGSMPKSLAEHRLARVHIVKGSQPEIALEFGSSPTRLQMSSLRLMADANPTAKFSYDLFKDGSRIKSGYGDWRAFSADANRTYQLGLTMRDMGRDDELGFANLGAGKPVNPLPNDPKYTKIHEKQNEIKPFDAAQAITDALAAMNDKQHDFARKYLDRWVDIKDVVKRAQDSGVHFSVDENPYYAAQLEFGGGNGWAEAAHWDMSDIKRDARKAGLYDETTAYLNLVGSKRAIQVVQEKLAAATARGDTVAAARYQERLDQDRVAAAGYTTPELNNALSELETKLGQKRFSQVKDFAQRFHDLARQTLDQYHAEGMISDELHNKFTSRGNEYVRMGRILEDVDEARGQFGSNLTIREQHGIKELGGSDLINKDPWASTLDNIALMHRDMARNRAARTLAEFRNVDPKGFGSMVRELVKPTDKAGKDEGTIAYFDKGKPRVFAVPEPIAEAVKIASAAETKMLGDALLKGTAQVFRASATGLNAAYALTSPIREFIDTGTMTWRSPTDAAKFTGNLFSSLYHITKRDEAYREFLRSGAAYSTLQSRIDPYVNLHGNEGVIQKLMHPLESVGQMNDALQTMSKMASRQTLIDRGFDPVEASAEARKYAGRPDVANAGTMTSQLNKLLIFFVDKLKGSERSYLFMKNNPKRFLVMSAALAAGELALNRWNAQFDSPEGDGSREWEHVSENDKRANYNILTPYAYTSSKGEKRLLSFKIPRGRFAAGGVARDLWSLAFKDISPKQAAIDGLADVLPGDFRFNENEGLGESVLRGTGQSLNPLLKEPLEQYKNEDLYSGHPIVPKGEEDIEPQYQYDESTSPTIKALAQSLNASPKRLEHAVRGIGAGVAEMVLTGMDTLMRSKDTRAPAEGPEAAARLAVIGPIVRRFLGSPTDQTRVDAERNFYDMRDSAAKATSTLDRVFVRAADRKDVTREYINQPDKLILANAKPFLDEAAKKFTSMREVMNRVARAQTKNDLSDMQPEWKGNTNKFEDDIKKQVIQGVHNDYVNLLKEANAVQNDVKNASKLTDEQRKTMFTSILNRDRSLKPEPDEEDDIK